MRDLSIELAQWLLTNEAQQALERLAGQNLGDHALISTLQTLREQHTPDEAAALLDQARLRQKGVEKFGERALRMLFLDEALQQASGQVIAQYRAARYAPFAHVADLGCGIGGDALALSEQSERLLALDLDPIRLLFAEHNLRVAGGPARARYEQADWTTFPFPSDVDAAFADPARRVEGRRVFSLHEMQPPLSAILDLQRQLTNLGVKVMPGVPDEELPPECEVEFISEGGTCKEGVLWFGALRSGAARTATIVEESPEAPIAHTLNSAAPAPPVAVTPPRAFLWEPDACVIRATLVAQVAHQLGASQVDEQIAYLTSDAPAETPFARGWPIIEHAPFNLKELNRRLRALDANVVAVKKRGSPIEPESFRRRLKSNPKGQPITLFVTRVRDEPWMILCGPELTG
jgi:hypothetical protein